MVPSLIPYRVHEWAWGVRTANEGTLVSSWPRRERWRLYLAVAMSRDGPAQLARYFRRWFRTQAALPGDHWKNWAAALSGVVYAVKRDYVILEVVADQFCPPGGGALDGAIVYPEDYPPGAVPSYVRVARNDAWHWMPV